MELRGAYRTCTVAITIREKDRPAKTTYLRIPPGTGARFQHGLTPVAADHGDLYLRSPSKVVRANDAPSRKREEQRPPLFLAENASPGSRLPKREAVLAEQSAMKLSRQVLKGAACRSFLHDGESWPISSCLRDPGIPRLFRGPGWGTGPSVSWDGAETISAETFTVSIPALGRVSIFTRPADVERHPSRSTATSYRAAPRSAARRLRRRSIAHETGWDTHREHREILGKALRPAELPDGGGAILNRVRDVVASWPVRKQFDLGVVLDRLALKLVADLALGEEAPEVVRAGTRTMRHLRPRLGPWGCSGEPSCRTVALTSTRFGGSLSHISIRGPSRMTAPRMLKGHASSSE